MRLIRLHLKAFGPFTDHTLDFGDPAGGLALVYGPNEAGKSSALRAMADLRFGIPMRSADNFIHPHPQMQVGGVFVDHSGRQHSLIRRKARQNTLSLADFSSPDAPTLGPAPPEVEALLTAGLSREAYETGFGIDHGRLRAGGRALVEGQGEVGSALFEASAGIRGIARVLDELDQAARRLFMPGARGRNARINEALRAFDESHQRFRQALVRPAHWTDLSRRWHAATETLAELEARYAELQARRHELAELRAVAPLLDDHDHAAALLGELTAVPALADDAASQRVAAETGLAAALQDAETAAAQIAHEKERLAALAPDPAIVELAAAVRRLIASAETIDAHRARLIQAETDAQACSRQAAVIEQAIAGTATPGMATPDPSMTARAPSPTRRAAIDEALQASERCEQALVQHRRTLDESNGRDEPPPAAELPPAPLRAALRTARQQLARHTDRLAALASLPAELQSARDSFAQALADAGLADEAAMRRARPLLDTRISEEIDATLRAATQRDSHRQRLARIESARAHEQAGRASLLAAGEVPTRSQLEALREQRDAEWLQLRQSCLDGAAGSMADASPGPQPADRADAQRRAEIARRAEAYEATVADADRMADALAADHARVLRLQALDATIGTLDRDADTLRAELGALAADSERRERAWRTLLAAAGLPELAPAMLRDWQARLLALREDASRLQLRQTEFEHDRALAARLTAALRTALQDLGQTGLPDSDADLDTLTVIADDLETELHRRERQLDTAAGQRQQQALERQRLATRGNALAAELEAARAKLRPLIDSLGLPDPASPAVVRARLAEFDRLQALYERRDQALDNARQARESLAELEGSARRLATALDDPAPADLRLYGEHLTRRLELAERCAREEALARQALASAEQNHRRHLASAERHRASLARLCAAAEVDTPAELPRIEALAAHKRSTQARLDDAASRLTQASRRPLEALRTRLASVDAARIDADEAACTRELSELETALREARASEESARLALRAIDASDAAAAEREQMELAAARIRADLPAWMRTRLAHALLGEALRRFRERAQGPMLARASTLFVTMTGGAFERLTTRDGDSSPVLLALRPDGREVTVDGLSEGTADQLFLALRLAALELRRQAGIDLPVVLDDVLMTADDERAAQMLEALADFASESQVIVFTHHRHLVELTRRTLGSRLRLLELD
ncbi:MAG: AAA family ATPase [Burkholderiaceae bacterium]